MKPLCRAIAYAGVLLLTTTPLSAKSVSPAEAAGRISVSEAAPRHITAGASRLRLAATLTAAETADAPAVYMFTRPDGSYVIAPGDDLFPAVLGYGDSRQSDFTPDTMPPAMKWWLEEYSRQMQGALTATHATAPEHRAVPDASMKSTAFTAIAPLLTTTWNQDAPFNNQTIIIGSEQAVTGCVATSMAQVMKYHQWPVTGTGSHSYIWHKYANLPSQELSCDFSTITFDWANMLDNYVSGGYNAVQANAVSTLMRAIDVAVEMNFGQVAGGGSGAYHYMARNALVDYFRYSRSAHEESRSDYSFAQWEELVYGNLARQLPVIMEGQAPAGGHSFVCDGYSSNHYFHFNWGWGGMSDGYFMLCALNPDAQGIGSYEGGYNSDIGMICDIMPVRDDNDTYSDPAPFLNWNGDFKYSHTENSMWYFCSGNSSVNTVVANHTSSQVKCDVGIIVEDSQGNRRYYNSFRANLPPGYGYTSFMLFDPYLSDGSYRIYPAYRNEGSEAEVMHHSPSDQQYVNLTVSDGTYTFTDPERSIELYGVSIGIPETIYSNSTAEFTVSVANLSDDIDFDGSMQLVISSEERAADEIHEFRMAVPARLTMSTAVGVTVGQSAGNYTVRLQDDAGNDISEAAPLTVSPGSEPALTSALQVTSLTPLTVGTAGPYSFSMIVKNTTSWQVSEGFSIKVLDKNGNVKYARPHDNRYYTFPGGQTYRIDIDDWDTSFAVGEYYIQAFGRKYNPSSYEWSAEEAVSKRYPLTVGARAESVELSHEEITLNESDTHTLSASVWPADALDRTVRWRSSKPEVATVDATGKITALASGKTTIIASTANGKAGLCAVTVNSPTGISAPDSDTPETVIAVYGPDGRQVLGHATETDLRRLAKGIYIVKTDRRTYKLAL